MKLAISNLLKSYEDRKLSRRQLVEGLALMAAATQTASAAGFQGTTIHHLSLQVSNLQKSTDWYQKTFNCGVNKRDGNTQLKFGKQNIVLREGKPARLVERTWAAGLTPAVNMDTGYTNLLHPAERASILELVRSSSRGRPFVAGAFVEGEAGAPQALYLREATAITAAGGIPILFPCSGTAGFDRTRLTGLMLLPPAVASPDEARPYFKALKNLRDRLVGGGVPAPGRRSWSIRARKPRSRPMRSRTLKCVSVSTLSM